MASRRIRVRVARANEGIVHDRVHEIVRSGKLRVAVVRTTWDRDQGDLYDFARDLKEKDAADLLVVLREGEDFELWEET